MSGHNKWSKIKHKKAATDAQKSKVFSKLARLISSESKKAGGDKEAPGLRAAIEKARSLNMPKDNIERAVSKGAGSDAGLEEEVIYEFYGPGGVAVIVTALTDNKNRTTPELKHILSKQGYELATPGSASWAFNKDGAGFVPHTFVQIDIEDSKKLQEIIEILEEHDDVQDVFVNAED